MTTSNGNQKQAQPGSKVKNIKLGRDFGSSSSAQARKNQARFTNSRQMAVWHWTGIQKLGSASILDTFATNLKHIQHDLEMQSPNQGTQPCRQQPQAPGYTHW